MSEQDTNTDRRMVVTVDWTGDVNMLEGLNLPFCVPNTFRAQGSIEFDGLATGRFKGTLWMVVMQSDIYEAIAYFGVQSVKVGIDDTTTAPFAVEDGTDADAIRDALWAKLDIEVASLKLPVRILNALKNENIRYVGEVVPEQVERNLRTSTPNFARVSMNTLKDTLIALGITFGMNTMGWVPPTDPSRTGQA